jgi:glutathione S-transferase
VLELYHNDMSTCAQKVRFALAEKAATWRSHHLDLRARDQQKPEYLKLNPNAVVPTLVHEGVVIIESTVINEYIDDALPGLHCGRRMPPARHACGCGQNRSTKDCMPTRASSARR